MAGRAVGVSYRKAMKLKETWRFLTEVKETERNEMKEKRIERYVT